MVVFFKLFIVSFFLFTLSAFPTQDAFEIAVDFSQSSALDISLPEWVQHTPIAEVTYTSDVAIVPAEFKYIVDFPVGNLLTKAKLTQVLLRLRAKGKFESVVFSFKAVAGGVCIHASFVAYWTFSKLKIRGLFRGKERYQQYYFLEPGEKFCFKKHTHSLEKMKTALQADGFFSASLESYFEYDISTKSVITNVVIDLDHRYHVADARFSLEGEGVQLPEASVIKEKAVSLLRARLLNRYYSHDMVTDALHRVKKYALKQGFIDPIVKIKRVYNQSLRHIKLAFQLSCAVKRNFFFFGNHFFSEEQLLELFSSFGSALSVVPDVVLQEEILNAYKAKGFADVSVSAKVAQEGTFFIINEGKRSTIASIAIFGNSAICSETLLASAAQTLQKKYMEQETIKEALQNLSLLYVRNGFWDAQLSEELVKCCDTQYECRISVAEGAQRFLASVTVDSVLIDAPTLPGTPMNIAPVPFNAELIPQQRQCLLSWLHARGYVYATVRHEVVPVAGDPYTLALHWHVAGVDTPVCFDKIIVQGSDTFPFDLLMRYVDFKEGDVWDQKKLKELLAALCRLGVFDVVHVYPYELTHAEEKKIVLVKLVHDDPFELRLRVGFQQVSKTFLEFRKGTTYKLGGSLVYKNPTNAADRIKFDADVTRFYRNISLAYERPWLGNHPVNTQMKGYTNKYIQPIYIGSDKPLYQATQQGFLASFKRRWSCVDAGITIGNEWMETNHLSVEVAHAINFEPALIDKKVPYVFIEPDVVFNYLDDMLNPTSGLLTILSGKLMIPWQRITPSQGFLKVLFDQSIFISPLPRLVCAMRFRFGHIFNKDFNNIMPPERFFLGGQNSIRSYQPDFGPPLGSFVEHDGKVQLVPRGGRSLFNFNLEARIAVWGSFGMVIFQDLGALIDAGCSDVENRLLAGTGFGVRYNTPVGPLRFDIGWKWRKFYEQEPAYAWFLTLGHAF